MKQEPLHRTQTLRSCAVIQDAPELHSDLLSLGFPQMSFCAFAPSVAVMFTSPPPSTPSITLPGLRMLVDRSISMVNRTPVWHKSRQQQCGCCMATKSLTCLCSICRMTRALLPPFLSHLPTCCQRSPSLPLSPHKLNDGCAGGGVGGCSSHRGDKEGEEEEED